MLSWTPTQKQIENADICWALINVGEFVFDFISAGDTLEASQDEGQRREILTKFTTL